jgi:hypothetical protein
VWFRYVDDTFVIIQQQHEQYFFEHINFIQPSIQFTKELETNGELPFLDIFVHKSESGHLSTSVYRKPTHTNQYLNFNSNHPLNTRIGVAKTLFDRANTIISDNEKRQVEYDLIKSSLKRCGYKNWALKRARRTGTESTKPKPSKGYVSVPYVKGISEPFKRIISETDCDVALKGSNTIKNLLMHPKDRDEPTSKTHVVYKINCEECSSTYIGQTKRRLKDRVKEHKDVNSVVAGVGVSGVADHVLNTLHQIDWNNIKVLDSDSHRLSREIKESIYINKYNPDLNRKGGFELSSIYTTLLKDDGQDLACIEGHLAGNRNEALPSVSI